MPDVSRDLAAQDFPSAGEKAFVWVALFSIHRSMSKPLAEYACRAHPECKRWECLNHALDLPRYASSSCASLQGLDGALSEGVASGHDQRTCHHLSDLV